MNRFRRSITAIAIAACLSACSASVAQTTDAAAEKWQDEAIRLAPAGRKIEQQEMRARLDLFKAKKPYRESPAKKTIPARSASE